MTDAQADLYIFALWFISIKPVGACVKVDRALDSRSDVLVLDSHYWSHEEVLGKLFIPCCLCPPSSDGYLME